MNAAASHLSPSEAARRLGISPKALRLYGERGLIRPTRTVAGWRTYGPAEMARLAEIVALRALGLSLAHIARVLEGDGRAIEAALATHQATLEQRLRQTSDSLAKLHALRTELAAGKVPAAADVMQVADDVAPADIAFELPWPWGGERFELGRLAPLTYIVGPLGSGKTRFAMRLAEVIPGAAFLGLDRSAADGAGAQVTVAADAGLDAHVAAAEA